MPKTLPTKERLAQALEELHDPRLAEIVARARAGVYDDFETTLPFPQATLIGELVELSHFKFASRVMNGEFDATEEEGNAWLASQQVLKEFFE